MLYMISSHIYFYCYSFFFFFFTISQKLFAFFFFFWGVFYWLNYSIHDFRATAAPLDRKTWIHLNQNIWMIRMMMIGYRSSSIAALAVKTLLAKQWDAHAMLLEVVMRFHVLVYLVSVPTAELSRVAHQSSKFMSSFHQINTPLWHVLLSWFHEWNFFQIHWTNMISNTWSFGTALGRILPHVFFSPDSR